MATCDTFIMTPSGIKKLHPSDRKNSFIIFMDIPEEIRRERLKIRVMPGDSLERRIEADKKDFEDFIDFDLKITSSELSEFIQN
jgi:dephospho-CoA kinase